VDPTALLILGVLWFLINLITGVKKKDQPPPRAPRREPLRPEEHLSPDATQREGSRLEIVLRELGRALEEARPVGQERMDLPDDEDIEERISLESEPEVVSLEQEVPRAARREYTQDEDAEKLVQKRIAAAAARDTARSKADHFEFDQQIRKEPADHTATGGYTAKQLRDAVVWREILGPPVSERRGEG
jgi:hypothetical protein